MKQQTLLNKNIIITAAADGIGLAIVEYCLNYGANVFLTDVNQKKLSILKKHPQYNKKLFKGFRSYKFFELWTRIQIRCR